MKKIIQISICTLLAFLAGYKAHKNQVFPLNAFIERNLLEEEVTKKWQKKISVYSSLTNKSEVNCPAEEDAYVIIGFGQSNSANYAGHRFYTNKNVVNFFNGKCYVAIDPLLGATGKGGSVWIPLSERLNVQDKTIVLSTFGVASSRVSDWLNEDYLLPFYKENIDALKKKYNKPNAIFWIQGESDVSTQNGVFSQQLKDWFELLRSDFSDSNIFVTGTSYCSGKFNDAVLSVQRKQAESIGAIYISSTDKLVQHGFRYDDCHFSEKGINALASLIRESWIK